MKMKPLLPLRQSMGVNKSKTRCVRAWLRLDSSKKETKNKTRKDAARPHIQRYCLDVRLARRRSHHAWAVPEWVRYWSIRGLGSAKLAIFAKMCKFLAGSFSAVSKRNFAREYAFDSIFQALQDLHPFAPLQSQFFRKRSV